MSKVSDTLGRTRYSLGPDSPGVPPVVEVVRVNSDGRKSIHIPERLVLKYAAGLIRKTAHDRLDQLLDAFFVSIERRRGS